jgi:hypothetical protein
MSLAFTCKQASMQTTSWSALLLSAFPTYLVLHQSCLLSLAGRLLSQCFRLGQGSCCLHMNKQGKAGQGGWVGVTTRYIMRQALGAHVMRALLVLYHVCLYGDTPPS